MIRVVQFLQRQLEVHVYFEVTLGVTGGITFLVLCQWIDVDIPFFEALISSMITATTALTAVAVIAATLSSGLSAIDGRVGLATSIPKFSVAAFSSVIALLASTSIGFAMFLLVGDEFRTTRYGLAGAWCGLVISACFRSVYLGSRVTTLVLKSRVPKSK